MQVRTAFFTIYGDYIRKDDEMITMPELMKLLASLQFSEEAIKAAIYRMRHQQIVVSTKSGGKTFYSLTREGMQKMEEGMKRTFREFGQEEWDGRWCVLIYSLPETERQLRDQLRKEITWLGFGQLTPGTWISPYNLAESVRRIVSQYGVEDYVQLFDSKHTGPSHTQSLVAQAWDLQGINRQFTAFIEEFEPRLQMYDAKWSDEKMFAERVLLVHEYRKFLHIDPQLPLELLPVDWEGENARRIFWQFYRMLTDGAIRFYKTVRELTESASSTSA